MFEIQDAYVELQKRRKAISTITKLIDRGISHSATPVDDLTSAIKESNRDAIADAIEQFTADEMTDFLIDLVETVVGKVPDFDFDELDSLAADMRYLANDLEDTAQRYRKAQS